MDASGTGSSSAQPLQPERPDVFVSYAREDATIAMRLEEALKLRGKDVWIDSEAIPKGADWWDRIGAGIEAARAVIAVLSPDFAASSVCGREIGHALEHNKRLLPIMCRDLDGVQVGAALEAVNWIFLDDARFEEAVDELVGALETDLAWLDQHARLLVRALEWRRADDATKASLLLRGADLRAAEKWLTAQTQHAERATSDQVEYIVASRRASTRRQRITLGAVGVALAVSLALTIFALVQRGEAINQSKIAQSQVLAARALVEPDSRVALDLAVQAMHKRPTSEARDALWRTLPKAPVLGARFGRSDEIGSKAVFSPDGKLLVTVAGKTPRVWDVHSRRIIAKLVGHAGDVRDAMFSPDGSLVVTNDDRDFRVWRPRTGKSVSVLAVTPALPAYTRHMIFSPDGRQLVTDVDGPSIVWKTKNWTRAKALSPQVVSFSPDGKQAVIKDEVEKDFHVVETAHWTPVTTLPPPIKEPIFYDLAYSPNGKFVAIRWSYLHSTTITIRSTADWKLVRSMRLPSQWAMPSFSADSRSLALVNIVGGSGDWNRHVGIWSTRTWKQTLTRDVGALSPDWKLGVRQHEEGQTFDLVDVTSDATVGAVQGAELIDDVVFDPGAERFVATAGGDGTVRLWQPPTPRSWGTRPTCAGDKAEVGGLSLGPHPRLAAVDLFSFDTSDGCIAVSRPGGQVTRLPWHHSLSFSPDGRYLAASNGGLCESAACRDAGLVVWPRRHWGPVVDVGGGSNGPAWSPDGKRLAIWSERTGEDPAGFYPRVSVYRTGTWELEGSRGTANVPSTGADFSADGTLVVSLERGSAVVWTAGDGKAVTTLHDPGGRIDHAAFAPIGDLVVTTGRSGAATVWHGRDGSTVAVLRAREPLADVGFSDDGKMLALVSRDETKTEVFSTAGWKQVVTVPGRFEDFSADDRLMLARTDADHIIHVRELDRGEQLAEIPGSAPFGLAVFDDNGRSIVTVGRDGVVRTYPCPSCAPIDDLLSEAEQRLAFDALR